MENKIIKEYQCRHLQLSHGTMPDLEESTKKKKNALYDSQWVIEFNECTPICK